MPSWIEIVRARLEAPADVVEEIAHQLEDAFEDARKRGSSETEARDEAMRQVPDWGAFARAVESACTPPESERRVRAALGSALWQDVRYGVRGLVANPGFAILASLALALGIGANTVAFTFVQSLLLQKLPVEDPEELVRIAACRTLSIMGASPSRTTTTSERRPISFRARSSTSSYR